VIEKMRAGAEAVDAAAAAMDEKFPATAETLRRRAELLRRAADGLEKTPEPTPEDAAKADHAWSQGLRDQPAGPPATTYARLERLAAELSREPFGETGVVATDEFSVAKAAAAAQCALAAMAIKGEVASEQLMIAQAQLRWARCPRHDWRIEPGGESRCAACGMPHKAYRATAKVEAP